MTYGALMHLEVHAEVAIRASVCNSQGSYTLAGCFGVILMANADKESNVAQASQIEIKDALDVSAV